jgi:integrase
MNKVAAKTERGPQERRALLMTRRITYQKGSVQPCRGQRNKGQWDVVYRLFDHASTKWSQKRERLGKYKNKKAANKAAETILARVNQHNNCTDPRMLYKGITFKEFIDTRWREYEVSAKHRESTIDGRNSFLKHHLMPFFGSKVMAEISPSDIGDFLRSIRGRLSTASQLQMFSLLHLMFEIARQYDYVKQNPVRPLVHKPDHERVEKPTLTTEQIRGILLGMPENERLFVTLLAVTGIRMGEGLALRWLNFNAAERELTITHTLYKGKLRPPKTITSKGKLRLHPVIVRLLDAHRQWSDFQEETDFIFARPCGIPFCQEVVRDHMHKAMDNIGIKRVRRHHGFHIFRHSAGTLLFDLLGDMGQVQSALRHRDVATTRIYVHSEQPVIEGVELLTEAILGNAEGIFASSVTQSVETIN